MNTSSRDIGRNVGAGVLIALGVVFLLGQFFGFHVGSLFNFSWPLWIILPGFALLFFALVGDQKTAPLAIPGSIVTGTGIILFFQNRFDYYESWAYAWALYPVFVGFGMLFMGWRMNHEHTTNAGRRLVSIGLTLFVIFAALFEMFVFHNLGSLGGRFLVPLLFIGLGVWLLLSKSRPSPMSEKSKRKNDEPVFTGEPVLGQRKNGYVPRASSDLQRRIDEAIAEDDPNEPKTSV
jgi:hypothetical protein